MAWTDNSFPFGSILTSSKMTNLQNNFAAMADGDSGAPEITNAALKTSTGNTNGTVTGSSGTNVSLQDYCFLPNFYQAGANNYINIQPHLTNTSTTIARFRLHNTNGTDRAYDIDYRYITASDKPFIYFIRDKQTGEILHTWWADDPPPGYWHLSDEEKANIESGESFDWPLQIDDWKDSTHESFAKFDYPEGMTVFREWTEKGKSDGKGFAKHMSDNFDFDTETKLFKPKNLQEI